MLSQDFPKNKKIVSTGSVGNTFPLVLRLFKFIRCGGKNKQSSWKDVRIREMQSGILLVLQNLSSLLNTLSGLVQSIQEKRNIRNKKKNNLVGSEYCFLTCWYLFGSAMYMSVVCLSP